MYKKRNNFKARDNGRTRKRRKVTHESNLPEAQNPTPFEPLKVLDVWNNILCMLSPYDVFTVGLTSKWFRSITLPLNKQAIKNSKLDSKTRTRYTFSAKQKFLPTDQQKRAKVHVTMVPFNGEVQHIINCQVEDGPTFTFAIWDKQWRLQGSWKYIDTVADDIEWLYTVRGQRLYLVIPLGYYNVWFWEVSPIKDMQYELRCYYWKQKFDKQQQLLLHNNIRDSDDDIDWLHLGSDVSRCGILMFTSDVYKYFFDFKTRMPLMVKRENESGYKVRVRIPHVPGTTFHGSTFRYDDGQMDGNETFLGDKPMPNQYVQHLCIPHYYY